MGLKEILAAKQDEMLKLAAEGAGVKLPPASSNQATGMASSTETTAQLPTVLPPIKGELDEQLAEASLAVYEDNDARPLGRYFKGNGKKVVPVAGFFYAQDEEDIKMLDHYTRIGYVTLVGKKD